MSWILLALISAFFAALVAIFGKIGISRIDSTLATTVRSLVMAGFLVFTSLALGKVKLLTTLDRRAMLFILLSGIAGALSWLFYFSALRSGPASGVAALDRLSVAFVFVLAILFLNESWDWRAIFGVVLLTGGAVLMSIR